MVLVFSKTIIYSYKLIAEKGNFSSSYSAQGFHLYIQKSNICLIYFVVIVHSPTYYQDILALTSAFSSQILRYTPLQFSRMSHFQLILVSIHISGSSMHHALLNIYTLTNMALEHALCKLCKTYLSRFLNDSLYNTI